jgi:aryl-alcohol dehydrogenase-like predicted oxidoreductase
VGLQVHSRLAGWTRREHEVKDLSAATLRRQVEETRALLGAHLRLYQIHSATLESGVLDAATAERLASLVEDPEDYWSTRAALSWN